MHESEKWKWSRSIVSDPQRPHGLQPSRLLHPWDFPGKSTGVGCCCLLHLAPWPGIKSAPSAVQTWSSNHYREIGPDMYTLLMCAFVCSVIQSCPTLYDLMDCSLSDSSVHGILQKRILGWCAMPSSRGYSQPRDQTQISCIAGKFFIVWVTREAQEYWSG